MSPSPKLYPRKLDHPRGRTEILIGAGALEAAAQRLGGWLGGRTLAVVSTPRLRELHGDALARLCGRAGRLIELEVADGEGAKTLATAERLWDEMLAAGGKRDSRLITFGGGTVGDLGGFVAGCFLRGIEYAQIPTTLLAQVDAAIGGKTAVDLAGGKNTVGLFHHPAWVVSDTALLATLGRAELGCGLVEVVKMALLLDPPLFEQVETGLDPLLAGDAEALAPVVAAATAAKCSVVESDPEEGDRRRLLNFGHTLGHAIEGVQRYEGLRHGEAVAYGLLFAVRLAARRGLAREFGERLRRLLRRFALPPLPALTPEALCDFMARDKKAVEAGLVWVLPSSRDAEVFGHAEMVPGIDRGDVLAELEAFLADPFAA
ncbi:MAG: 3-dehydroquinate synthase [bacterium]|nr:3-dehydroquinate synthase [bacterium]